MPAAQNTTRPRTILTEFAPFTLSWIYWEKLNPIPGLHWPHVKFNLPLQVGATGAADCYRKAIEIMI
jgi:hypothetical protein